MWLCLTWMYCFSFICCRLQTKGVLSNEPSSLPASGMAPQPGQDMPGQFGNQPVQNRPPGAPPMYGANMPPHPAQGMMPQGPRGMTPPGPDGMYPPSQGIRPSFMPQEGPPPMGRGTVGNNWRPMGPGGPGGPPSGLLPTPPGVKPGQGPIHGGYQVCLVDRTTGLIGVSFLQVSRLRLLHQGV